jgi:hypothetical protein
MAHARTVGRTAFSGNLLAREHMLKALMNNRRFRRGGRPGAKPGLMPLFSGPAE